MTGGDKIDRFLASGRSRGRRGGKVSALTKAVAEAKRLAASGDWSEAAGKDLVGLYAFCHEAVYGVAPNELLDAGQFRAASRLAAKLTRSAFGGSFDECAAFVRWTWLRERGREKWAAEQDRKRGRLGWRLAFSIHFVTDYRVEMTRDERRRG